MSTAWAALNAAIRDLSTGELSALIQNSQIVRDQFIDDEPDGETWPRPAALYAALAAVLATERRRRQSVIRDARQQMSRVTEAGWAPGRERVADDDEPDVLGPFEGLGDPPEEASPGDVGGGL